MRAQQVDKGEKDVGRKRGYGGMGQQGKERQQEGRLVVDAAIVGRYIMRVEEEAFLDYVVLAMAEGC